MSENPNMGHPAMRSTCVLLHYKLSSTPFLTHRQYDDRKNWDKEYGNDL
jgi:hypothetical protein